MPGLDFSDRASDVPNTALDFSARAAPDTPAYTKALADARADATRNKGKGQSSVRSLAQGMMLGFSDEIAGAADAGLTGLANLTGNGRGYTAADAYRATVQAQREQQADFHQQHPVADTALQVGGGLLTPGVGLAGDAVKSSATLGQAAVRSGLIGGAYGAVAGAGNANGGLIDRAKGAGVGLIAGSALGAATPPVARAGIGLLRRGTAAAAEAGASAARAMGRPAPVSVLSPETLQAAQDRALAYVDDLTTRSGKTTDDLAAHPAEAMGKPVTAAEAIGRPAMYQLGTLGKRSGTTADALEGVMDARRLDAPNRLTGDISQALGVDPAAARGSIDTLVDQGRKNAGPLYDAALAGDAPVTSSALTSLSTRPVVQKALKSVATSILNAGEDPMAHGLEVTGAMDNGLPQAVSVKAPTAATWDRVKKAVADQVERHPITNKVLPNTASAGNRDIAVASGDLTSALRDAIPGYGDALDASGDYLSHQAAFDRVKGAVFKTQMPAGDFDRMWTGLSPSQQDAGRASIANDFHNLAQNGRLAPRLFATPSVKSKLTTAFGPEKTQDLIARVEQEALLAKGQRMSPGTNSTTGETAFAGDEQDNGMGLIAAQTAGRVLTGDGHGAVAGLGRAAIQGLLAPVRGAATPLAEATRNEVGRLLQLRPSELAAELTQFRTRAPVRKRWVGGVTAPVAGGQTGRYADSNASSP